MSPAKVHASILRNRLLRVSEMVDGIRRLPIEDPGAFLGDARNPAAAESQLRRALAALLDLGRHIAAKGYGLSATEYKAVPAQLERAGVLSPTEAEKLRQMAGYRNRLVHFYDEVTPQELLEICTTNLDDVIAIAGAYERWSREHPGRVDREV